jgi:uncharacterized protein
MHQLITQILNYADGGAVTFGFQGGEPLLAPLSYYREFVTYARENNRHHSPITYTIQTNGMFITHEHADFFKQNQFLVGISIDGPEDIHNYFRKDRHGKPSHASVVRGVRLLIDSKITPHALIVISSHNARRITHVYEHIKSLGIFHMQFIPVIEPLDDVGFKKSYSLSQDDYALAYKNLWHLYQTDNRLGVPVSLRYFDNLNHITNGKRIEQCGLSGICHAQIVVENDGSVYPCDFYADDKHRMGNLMDDDIASILKSNVMKKFIIDSFYIHEDCMRCDAYQWCRGGCKREHVFTQNGHHKYKYCMGIKDFLNYIKIMNSLG